MVIVRFQGPTRTGAIEATRPKTGGGRAVDGCPGRCDRAIRPRPARLMALIVKDGLAMRLTKLANRYTLAAAVALTGPIGL